MNYQRIYDNLIAKHGTWEKPKGVHTERHRKIPGYLGGEYVKGNAFYVSVRVHYLAHVIWAKITNDECAWLTVKLMRFVESGKTSRIYETAKLKSLPLLHTYLAKARKIAGDNAWANKTGVHAADKNQKVAWSKTAGEVSRDLKLGVHSASHDTLSDWGKRANFLRYKCDCCDMVTSAGALGKHQSCSNHSGRTLVS